MQTNKKDITEVKKNSVGSGLLIENDGYISMNEGKNKLIKEAFESQNEWYCPNPFIVNAVFQKFDIVNANGRIYPENVLKREVEKYQARIREHRAIGEANHPQDSTIDLGRISHNITELHWEGNTLVGQLELNLSYGFIKQGIASTLGDTVANLLLNGYKIGVSSRGVGSVEQRLGKMIVGDDYEIICWDIVADPSTPNAYISNDEAEIASYVESADKKGSPLNEKISMVKQLLK